MKRFFFTLAIIAVAAISAIAQNKLTKEYKFGKITSIEASSVYDIEVTQGNSGTVKVVYDEIFKDRLMVNYINGKLNLEVASTKMRNNNRNIEGIKVYLQMPTIENLDLSGASSLKAMGSFKTDELDVELSGASSISGLVISGNDLSLDCSGASTLNLKGDFKTIEAEISGASEIVLNSNSTVFEGEFSGASTVKVYGDHKNTDVVCSGASNLTLEGKTDYIKSVTTGASNLKAQEFTALNGYAQVSGASNAKVRCTGDLKIMVGRASKLTYYGNPNIINLNTDNNIKKGDD
ncbi:MAG: DUF2807 domain-containing protein [Bacteroidales bacterium]|nr:DUF2807 domain-containing protein [Bacteroidales bacterium]MBQ7019056.1 DUF2807 domain-containing protein [Bacteroidales bacterium]